MKRSEALLEIKQCGYHNDLEGASCVRLKKNIGSAAARKAFMDGRWDKEHGRPCDCPKCVAAREGEGDHAKVSY
jgi:hypothetical protein